jgi:hypothetical protein
MFELAPNPYGDPFKKFLSELKGIKWKPPFILQGIQAFISIIILFILCILYATIGIIAQISTTFWDLVIGMGEKMSFSQPIESSAYAIALILYFMLFLPFFILQSPIWLSGWLASKIGYKPFIAILFVFAASFGIYLFIPEVATNSYSKILKIQDSIRTEYFSSDSVKKIIEEPKIIETKEIHKPSAEKASLTKKKNKK